MFDATAFVQTLSEAQRNELRKALQRPKNGAPKLKRPEKVNCLVRFADGTQFGLSVLSRLVGHGDAPQQAERTARAIYAGHLATREEWRRDGKYGTWALRPVAVLPDVIEARAMTDADMEFRRGVRAYGLDPDADADVLGDDAAMEARRDELIGAAA